MADERNTAWCEECQRGWLGGDAWDQAESHEATTGHVVWYDETNDESLEYSQ